MQKTKKVTLAGFASTCKACGKPIVIGSPCVYSDTLKTAKGKAAFVHQACGDTATETATTTTEPVRQIVDAPLPPIATTMDKTNGVSNMSMEEFRKRCKLVLADMEFDLTDDLKPAYDRVSQVETKFDEFKAETHAHLSKIATQRTGGTFKIEVQVGTMPKVTLKETPNAAFEKVLKLAANRMNVLMVGPAGSGKTHLAETVAKVLKLDFAHISCSAGMSEGHILGRLLPTGKGGAFEYTISEFIRVYENGGIFLFDEIDAADSNLMLIINSALANGFVSVPNRHKNPIAKRHKNFICIAAANTFGRGADRMYVGRNQLDESTLDRFRIGQVQVDYDQNVEASLCPDDALRGKLLQIRERVMAHGMRRVVSTRFMKDAYVMLKNGFTQTDIVQALTMGWTADEIAKVA